MNKYIDSEKLIAEIRCIVEEETPISKGSDYYHGVADTADKLLSFITSLQQEQKCIFGNTPSEDICSVCSAYCSLRVPKTKVSTSTEIATPSRQVEELTFEEYLRGVFEINNGIENDPDNLVRIHAPELLKLARKHEQSMPDSTKLIEFWNEDKEILKEKDFRDDAWRLAYNAFMCGFGRGIAVKKQEQPEVDLEKFTEKMDAWKARYNHPDNIPIKATMAFTARMFYMYPDIAREWYDSLPKATMD